MTARRVLLALGSLWDLVRFFLVLSLLALLLGSPDGGQAATVPLLVLAGTGNLLVPVGVLMYVLFPGRHGSLLALLRLGKALAVFSWVLVLASGSFAGAGRVSVLRLGARVVTAQSAAIAMVVLDAAFLLLLLLPAAPPRSAPGPAVGAVTGPEVEDPR